MPAVSELVESIPVFILTIHKGRSNSFGVITTIFKPIGQLMLRLLSHNYSLRLTGPLPCSEQGDKCYKKEFKKHIG